MILDARKHAGLPQRRERLFMIAVRKDIADFNPFNFFEETRERISLKSLLVENENNHSSLYLDAESKYHDEMWGALEEQGLLQEKFRLVQYRKYRPRIIDAGLCPTLTQNMGAGGHNVPFYIDQDKGEFRKLSIQQCLALQGFQNNFQFPSDLSDGAKLRMIGNAVSPLISNIIAKKTSEFLEGVNHEFKLAV